VFFRRSIELPAKPTSAIVRVSADARYVLYVNGRRVHSGPARCYPRFQSYDTLDLADFLTAGANAVCAIVHQVGVPTGQSVYRDASGFILDGVVDTDGGTVAVHTPAGWLCREAAGWRKHVARLSPLLGFQEHFDADADPPDWLTPEYAATEEAGWKAAVAVAPAGGHPWSAMTPRGAPLLADYVESFAGIVSELTGANARGYKIAEDVYQLSVGETRKKAKVLIENSDAMLRDDDQPATLAPPPDGQFHAAVLDLGSVKTAHIILDVMDAAGDEIVDVLYLQEVDKASAPLLAAGEVSPADRYRCRPGPQRWEAFSPTGFRYAAIVFRNVEKPLKIRHVGVRTVHAAVAPVGAFESSDERLNRIYDAGVKTLQTCMLDAYVDHPDQSQAQRWSDARTAARAGLCAFEDLTLLERGIVQMAQSQAADGSLHGHPPADAPRARSVDSMLAWIGTLVDHHAYTGRTDLLRECQPALDRLLEFFAKHEKLEGLIGDFEGFEVTIDSGELHRANFSGPLNLMYLRALKDAAEVYKVLGQEKESAWMAQRSATLAKSVEKHFYDAAVKGWRDGFDAAKNAPVEQTSVQTAALAVLCGFWHETNAAVARDTILKAMNARRGKTVVPSPAGSADVLDALVEAGLRKEAIELIRSRWGVMVDRGATTLWEEWDGTRGSRCHSAATSPVVHLSQQILGVRSVATAWKRVRIEPLTGELDFARGTTPSPMGPIRVEWEKVGDDQLAVRVELPEGIEGEFVDPLGESRQLDAGASEFHT
jgi:hypothetical protein